MKMNRFENEAFEHAKERVGSLSRVPVGKARKSGPTPCAVPIRPAPRRRMAVAGETTTTITARVDVGFGNCLFVRGEGEGLNWDKGQPLVCVDGLTWTWSRRPAKEPVTFKLLINDQVWSRGENYTVGAGGQVEIEPGF